MDLYHLILSLKSILMCGLSPEVAGAKDARSKIVKSIGGFVKTAVKKSAGKIADALTDSALAPLGKLHSNNLKSIEAIKSALIAL